MRRPGRPPKHVGCLVRDCSERHRSRGFCANHYLSFLHWGDPLATGRVRRCELCEVDIVGDAMHRLHVRSTSHRNMKRFKVLLTKDCITLSEIGDRLGFTRERARQLANRFGVKGMTRLKVCTLERHTSRRIAEIEASPLIKTMRAECEKRGLSMKATGKRTAIINGIDVRLGRLRLWNGYWQTSSMRNRDAEILAFIGKDHWLIIPSSKYTVKVNVMFSPHEPAPEKPGNLSANHFWRDYIDAWHLLEAK